MRRAGWRIRPLLVALVVVVASGAAGCGGGDRDELVVYSGRTENLILPLLEQFEDESGIDVAVKWGDSAELALLMAEEGGQSDADVFISQSPGAVGFLAERDLLGTLPEEVTSLVPEGDAGADGSWVGMSGRVRTLVYNTEMVDPETLPDSVLDLTGTEYTEQVALAPTNGSFQDFVTVLRSELGEDEAQAWLEGMAENDPQTYDNNTAIVEAVGRGEVPMGLVNHYYAFRSLAEDPDLPIENYYFPEGDYGSTLLVTAVSTLRDTNQPEDAQELVEFLLSEEAQRYFSLETFEFPLVPGSEPNPALPPFDEINTTRVDMASLGGELEATIEMINQSGLST